MLLQMEKLGKKLQKTLTDLDKMVLPPCTRCLSLCQGSVSCSGTQGEAAVKRCSAPSASVNTRDPKGELQGWAGSSCADFQEETLVKCEQEGLEQSRGEWPLKTVAGHLLR